MARRPFDGQVSISQEYGTPNRRYRKGYHTGVDYRLGTGHKLVSPTNGTVRQTGYESSAVNGRGHFIIILGDDGVSHHLYHMSQPPVVRTGSRVTAGQHVGYVGNSGASDGPHLHWETRRSPHDGTSDFAPGTWLFAGKPVYVPAPQKEYVRIFGDYRTLYSAPGSGRKAILAPRLFGGKLDYQVLARSGQFVQIQTSFFGKGWIYCGPDVANLTQFYRA